MLIEVALNGNRPRSEHPGVPQSPAELADAARGAVEAGAGVVHFHVFAADGRESLESGAVAAAIAAVRAAIPATPFGISTGDWILRDAALRHQKIAELTVLPEFVSINFNEDGAIALAELVLSRGMGIEAGVGSVEAAKGLLRSGCAARCLRVPLEPEQQDLREALAVVDEIEKMLDRAGVAIPRLLHGYDATAWPMIGEARRRGYDTRIGFEDSVRMPNGELAMSNAEMVAGARRLVTAR